MYGRRRKVERERARRGARNAENCAKGGKKEEDEEEDDDVSEREAFSSEKGGDKEKDNKMMMKNGGGQAEDRQGRAVRRMRERYGQRKGRKGDEASG